MRLQTQTGFKGGWDCLKRTVKGEGVLSLFKGMSGPLCTIPLVNAIVFYSYATAKNFMHKLQTEKVSRQQTGSFAHSFCLSLPPLGSLCPLSPLRNL